MLTLPHGGNLRSIGRAAVAVAIVLRDCTCRPQRLAGMQSGGAMRARADLATAHPRFEHEVLQHIEALTITGGQTMGARGRQLLVRRR